MKKVYIGFLGSLVGFFFLLYVCHYGESTSLIGIQGGCMVSHLSEAWYPQKSDVLRRVVHTYVGRAEVDLHNAHEFKKEPILALIVPHAAQVYSGFCAGAGYAALVSRNIKKAIILAPSHYSNFEGIALCSYDCYRTSLGKIPIDSYSYALLQRSEYSHIMDNVYQKEHAIEIQLPFLQVVLPDIAIVPVVVGSINSSVLDSLIPLLQQCIDSETVLIVSTDFTHYGMQFDYTPFSVGIHEKISLLDGSIISAVGSNSLSKVEDVFKTTYATVCGKNALVLLMRLFEAQKCSIMTHLACYYISPQVRLFENDRVDTNIIFSSLDDSQMKQSVSYASILCTKKKEWSIPTEYEAATLCAVAREAIEERINTSCGKKILQMSSSLFEQRLGVFVTLKTKNGALRGCIGSVVSEEPLKKTVVEMAVAAAFSDARFNPVTYEELNDIDIEISLLSRPSKIEHVDEIIMGTHGVILHVKDGEKELYKRALFLPEVAREQGWSKEEMLEHLSQKAGCAHDAWKQGEFEVFTTIKVGESKD